MNKNKGFTLIELIVTIALLAALSLVVGLSVSGMFDRQKERQYDEFIKRLEDAACIYVEHKNINGNTTVTLDKLISEGLIDKNLENPLSEANPKETVSSMTSSYVEVKWVDYEKICTYKES